MQPSPIKWAVRWDVYSQMTDVNVHWFSIINSLMIALFLTGMVAMIMARTLHRDFRRYNELEQDDEAQQEETGWKLVHGDVFRPPQHGGLFSVLVGSGVQILLMSLLTLFFAVLGFLSPANRGGLMTALVLLFVFMGVFAGYYSSRIYKMFGLLEWRKNTLHTAIGFPATAFAMFFFLNLLVWSHHSSGAVPFGAMFALLVLWFGISVPLVYLGSYIGYKKQAISVPVKVNQIPRQVPEQAWYMIPYFSVLVGGLLPFGAVFIEVFFIMGSIWKHQFYYLFGFLFLVFFILVLTCAEITIVMCYFQLCSEDYHWFVRPFPYHHRRDLIFVWQVVEILLHIRCIGALPLCVLNTVLLHESAHHWNCGDPPLLRIHASHIGGFLPRDRHDRFHCNACIREEDLWFDQGRLGHHIVLVSNTKRTKSVIPVFCLFIDSNLQCFDVVSVCLNLSRAWEVGDIVDRSLRTSDLNERVGRAIELDELAEPDCNIGQELKQSVAANLQLLFEFVVVVESGREHIEDKLLD